MSLIPLAGVCRQKNGRLRPQRVGKPPGRNPILLAPIRTDPPKSMINRL